MAANRLEPVYLIVGADDLKRETACKRLTHRFEDMGDITLNLDNISAERGDVDDIIGACNTLPFASEMRLVIVRDAERRPPAMTPTLSRITAPTPVPRRYCASSQGSWRRTRSSTKPSRRGIPAASSTARRNPIVNCPNSSRVWPAPTVSPYCRTRLTRSSHRWGTRPSLWTTSFGRCRRP